MNRKELKTAYFICDAVYGIVKLACMHATNQTEVLLIVY